MAHDVLPRLVAAAVIFSAISFWFQVRRAARRGRMTAYAPARGDAHRGVIYAFTRGMDPRAKDGAHRHPWVLLGGILFHAGVFAAVVTAVALFALSSDLGAPGWKVAGAIQAAAAASALALIARRSGSPMLRAISRSDDYVSTILVFATLVSGAGVTVLPELRPMFAAAFAVLVAYAPFGKIRHCVLFFPARIQHGRLFGRRGVLPPGGQISIFDSGVRRLR